MDSVASRTDALQQMPLLAGLPARTLQALAGRLKVESYAAGVEIIRQGTTGSSAYLLVSGGCDVRRGLKKPRRVATLGPGDFFGELSIIAPAPRSAAVLTREPTVVLVLSGEEFRAALAAHPPMLLHLVRTLALRLQREVDEFGG